MAKLSLTTRYRHGSRRPAPRAAHSASSKQWRRKIAASRFGPREQQALFAGLRKGLSLTQAAKPVDMTANAVYGRARWDEEFRDRLEAVLDETCPGGEWCGTATGAKRGGHCLACRRAHHPPRQSR
ncbi:hypothetical protein [Amycolatopsis rubida]|uniref:Uncharacterized protein n=1 Tax=Amycolatopsis rubida TaxID=112413 RepID=A0A1I6BM53_9PSEU|nr:hypothetical protein [Amycolatopsis rubida]SFQ82000.1 hypothetical protein SAMN05421854_13212 [Amycolatopsis rubida]